jgi:hypothetical protein
MPANAAVNASVAKRMAIRRLATIPDGIGPSPDPHSIYAVDSMFIVPRKSKNDKCRDLLPMLAARRLWRYVPAAGAAKRSPEIKNPLYYQGAERCSAVRLPR